MNISCFFLQFRVRFWIFYPEDPGNHGIIFNDNVYSKIKRLEGPKWLEWTVKHLSEWICMLGLFTMSSSERTCHPQMIEAMSTSHSAPLGSVKINTFLSVIYPIAASLGYGLYSSYFLSPIPPDPGRFPTSAPAISCGRLPTQLALQARTPGRDGPCRDVGNDSGISWKL